MAELVPAIQTRTISLPLANASLLPFPLALQINQLSSKSVMLFISTPPINQSNMMKDTSVAMPVRPSSFWLGERELMFSLFRI